MGSNSIYKKISMNKVVSSYVIFIIVLITSFSKAQTYSQNREKFVKELMNGLSDIKTSDPRDFAKNELKNMLIETSDFPDDYFKRMVETCNLLETKKLHTYPEIYNYVYSMYSIIEKKQSSASYKAWHTAVDQLLSSKNLNKFKDFIELSSDFFSKGIISDAPNHVWLFKGGKFSFDVTEHRKHCLLNGLDEIGLTLAHSDKIRAFEAQHQANQPWLFAK